MRKATPFLVPAMSCAAALLTSCASVNRATPPGTPYLYVASGAAANLPQPTLTGYAIAADGSLTPIPCESFAHAQVLALAGFRSLLFASAQPSGPASSVISSYSIASNGCLTLKSTADVTAQGAPLSLFLDRQGETLYSWVWLDAVTSGLRSYSVDRSSGAVKLTGESYAGYPTYLSTAALPAGMLAFSPDDSFAVSSTWAPLDSTGIYVYQRSADGTLHSANIFANSPAGRGSAMFATEGAAGDNAGHFIVAGVVCAGYWACPSGPVQLAVYTLESQRNLTTQSTPQSMATPPSNGLMNGYAFSPDSRYFATGAGGGIDVYQWDAFTASLQYLDSITMQGNGFTGRIVEGFTWDRYDHLIFTSAEWSTDGESPESGQIQVYSVTPSGTAPAPGSPYALNAPHLLTVVNVPPPSPF